jgi:magnesium-transporting ATPase (P-type)
MAFTTLALSELLLVFSIRSPTLAAWRTPANPWLDASVLASAAFLAGALYVPVAHEPFATVALPLAPALTSIALAVVPSVAIEATKFAQRRRKAQTGTSPHEHWGRH